MNSSEGLPNSSRHQQGLLHFRNPISRQNCRKELDAKKIKVAIEKIEKLGIKLETKVTYLGEESIVSTIDSRVHLTGKSGAHSVDSLRVVRG